MRAEGIETVRRILCVFPRYTPSFGTFAHAFRLMYRVRAFMPPQGLLLIAAYLPAAWEVRFIDENIARATPAELAWAEVVMVSAPGRPFIRPAGLVLEVPGRLGRQQQR